MLPPPPPPRAAALKGVLLAGADSRGPPLPLLKRLLLGRWPPEALFALAAAARAMASAAAWTVTAAGYTNRSLTPAALNRSVQSRHADGSTAGGTHRPQLVLDHQAGAA